MGSSHAEKNPFYQPVNSPPRSLRIHGDRSPRTWGGGGGRNCTGTIRREVEARCFFDAQCCAPCPAGVGAADGIQPPSCSVCYLIDPHPVVSCSLSSALQKQSCPPISPPLGAGPENGKKRGRRERRAQLLLLLLHCPDLGNTTVGSGLCVWGGGCGCQGAWCK